MVVHSLSIRSVDEGWLVSVLLCVVPEHPLNVSKGMTE